MERKRKYGLEGAVSEMSTRRRHLDIDGSLVEVIRL
jgi:hypothetical protein